MHPHTTLTRTLIVPVAALAVVGLTACGGQGSGGQGSGGQASGGQGSGDRAAYKQCMSQHGVTKPSRTNHPSTAPAHRDPNTAPPGVDQGTWSSARAACASLAPKPPSAAGG